jgi:hypothetical protein
MLQNRIAFERHRKIIHRLKTSDTYVPSNSKSARCYDKCFISVRSRRLIRRHDDTCLRKFSSHPLSKYDGPQEKSIEQQYSKKTPLEHVLLRPGMYVGPVERLPPNHCWVLDPIPQPYFSSKAKTQKETATGYSMAHKEYGLVPALIKIFDEILVNASDNRLRNPKTCTLLDVRIDPGGLDRDPFIRIWNNGKGIPIQVCSNYRQNNHHAFQLFSFHKNLIEFIFSFFQVHREENMYGEKRNHVACN